MPGLPMQCGACGLRFDDDQNIHIRNSTQITIADNRTSCPRCGQAAHQVAPGTYDVDADGNYMLLVRALRTPGATSEDYARLREKLQAVRTEGLPEDQVADAIRTTVPSLAGVGDFLESQKGLALATWLVVLISLLGFWLAWTSRSGTDPEQPPNVTVNVNVQTPSEQQINEWIKKALEEARPTSASGSRSDRPGPLRNKPCSCGSGRKYKKCCGAPTPSQ